MINSDILLEVNNLKKYFPVKNHGHSEFVKAVDGVSFVIHKGETYGLVGESGCGKSTLGRCILRLIEPSDGHLVFEGNDFTKKNKQDLRTMRSQMQMVFQDPYMSLDPKKRVGNTLTEALEIQHVGSADERFIAALRIMNLMGFQPEHFFRYPHEFSGGQRQRIGLARALILKPKLIICDEPVSALDVSVQAQILNLMEDIKDETHVSYLFITHNLSVVKHISNRIGVMYLGHLVEEAETEELFANPLHPYTKALLSAISSPNPHLHKKHIVLKGEMPSPLHAPKGCPFSTRCPYCDSKCVETPPTLESLSTGSKHRLACFKMGNLK